MCTSHVLSRLLSMQWPQLHIFSLWLHDTTSLHILIQKYLLSLKVFYGKFILYKSKTKHNNNNNNNVEESCKLWGTNFHFSMNKRFTYKRRYKKEPTKINLLSFYKLFIIWRLYNFCKSLKFLTDFFSWIKTSVLEIFNTDYQIWHFSFFSNIYSLAIYMLLKFQKLKTKEI